MATSQFVPDIRIGYLYTYLGPLCLVLFVTICREVVDDLRRHKRDQEVNNQKCKRLLRNPDKAFEIIPASKLKVGDLIIVDKDERVPTHLILLRTSEKAGAVFIRINQFDGETNWKLRLAISDTQKLTNHCQLFDLNAEKPQKDICTFIHWNFYQISATPIDKEGYLNKRGEVSKSFQKRYFVLKGNLLFYFEKKGDKEPIGVIILEGCTIELDEDEEQFSFKIEFHGTNNRCYVLGAESQESMEQWMKALACAGYDYMKLMVAELQRQLDDIEETPIPLAQAVGSPVPPPRQRHNPFNKPDSNPHQRSHSMRSAPGRMDDNTRHSDLQSSKATISFWELHNSYGRPILTDFNAWKHAQRLQREKVDAFASPNLINL